MTEESKIPDWYLLECKCGKFLVTYPFVRCPKCSMSSVSNLKDIKPENIFMKCLANGFGYPDISELQKKYGLFDDTRSSEP